MSRVALLAAVAVALVPLALGFTTAPMALRSMSARACVTSPASARRAPLGLRMSEDGAPEAVAGVSEVSDEEQRSLSKTRTNKRPRADNKNKKPLSEYTVGDTVTGKVVSIMPYGAFVDVGTTTDGLVHVSQIADDFVSDIESVVKVGDEVSVRIMTVDEGSNKISLSMRSENAKGGQRQGGGGQRSGGGGRSDVPEQFRNFDDKVFIDGKVASVMEYGCFVSIAEGVDALVHVSEISEERNVDPSKMFKVGQDVKVRIISYDKSKRRLSLSMKEWTEAPARDETDDIKSYVDPVPENQKTAFQVAWEAAQQKTAA